MAINIQWHTDRQHALKGHNIRTKLGLSWLLALQIKCTDVQLYIGRLRVQQNSVTPDFSVRCYTVRSRNGALCVNSLFVLLPSTPVTNQSTPCFSWVSPPNILVKMTMSDSDFYISPQLVSHPCSPSTLALGEGLTHTHQSLTSLFLLPLHALNPSLLPPDTQACCHQCPSQPPSCFHCPFFFFCNQFQPIKKV